ncbi:MAG: VOC family protein [Actinomycetota bacterium]|nr:VOC family protein [Actinomycetota bacterium]
MTHYPVGVLSGVVLDSREPRVLCDFYERLLGWRRTADEPDWCKLMPPEGATGLSFQLEPGHQPPVWPTGDQHQMQIHLDFAVRNLPNATEYAVGCGASLAEWQPQDDVRVLFDPEGHPFCLFLLSPMPDLNM